jgi:hypothetical protein
MANPLYSVPGLGGFVAQQETNEQSDLRRLQAMNQGLTLRQHYQEQQELERAKGLMQSGKDPNGLILELMRLGPKGAVMAKQYADALQGAEQYGVMRDTRDFLKKFQQPTMGQQMSNQAPRRGTHPLRQAASELAMVNPKAAENLIDIARKIEVQYGTTPHVLENQEGKLVVGVLNQAGDFVELPGYKPGPQIGMVNLGDVTLPYNRRSGDPTGRIYTHGTSPNTEARLGFEREEAERPVWDSSRGQFISRPPPHRLGPGTPGGQTLGQAPASPYSRTPPIEAPGPRELPLSDGARRDLQEATTQRNLMEQQVRSFRNDFGGNFIMGGLENTLKRWFPQLESMSSTSGQADWWSAMANLDNLIRHPLFGSTFTPGETKIWLETTVTPRDDPSFIRDNLRRRGLILDQVLTRMSNSLGVRHNRQEIEEIVKQALSPKGQPTPGGGTNIDDPAYRDALMRAIADEVNRRQGR